MRDAFYDDHGYRINLIEHCDKRGLLKHGDAGWKLTMEGYRGDFSPRALRVIADELQRRNERDTTK